MIYVKRIATNVKVGANVELGEKTLVVGPNFSGKSTVVNGVELATTGRASDVAGRRTLALDAELATLIPPGVEEGTASAVFSNGETATWRLAAGHRAQRTGPGAVFPLREVQEELTGSPERARKWLLGKIAARAPWPTVLALLPTPLHERISVLASGSILGLPTALEAAKKSARDAKRKADTLRMDARSVATTLPPPPDAAAVAAARSRAHAETSARIAELRGTIAKLDGAVAKTPAPAAAFADAASAIIRVLRGQVEAAATKCGACGNGFSVAGARARLAAVEVALGDNARAGAAYVEAKTQAAAARSELAGLERALAAAPEPGEIAALRARWAEVQRQETEAVASERLSRDWEEIAAAIAAVISRLVDQARRGFEGAVQRFLPAGMTFGLDLLDGDREVTRYGLRERIDEADDTVPFLRSALSGAEWAIVTTAIASAVATASGPMIIVPEERAFDPDTLTSALAAFSTAPAQVIVTSPVPPRTVPKGWTVITVGARAAAPAPELSAAPADSAFDPFDGAAVPSAEAPQAPQAPPPKRKRGRPPGRRNRATLEAEAAGSPAPPDLMMARGEEFDPFQ